MINNIRNWFTPATREKIYTAIAALAPIFVAAGLLAPGQVEPVMVLVGAGLQVLSGALALINLKPTEAARWFGTVGRGLIYGSATTVAGAVVVLGLVTQDWASGALTYVSLGLTALQAVLAVVTPKEVTFDQADIPAVADAVVINNAVIETAEPVVVEPKVAEATLPDEVHGDGRDL